MTPLLKARGVTVGTRIAPADVTSAGGELVALVGANGSGKTSLLRALARVEGAGGTVSIEGETLDGADEARRRRLMSFLPANREVAWPISVRDVVALGLAPGTMPRVDALLEELALSRFSDRSIGTLSTGERARVLLARALAAEPRLLLLDEPFSNLDPLWSLRTVEVLRQRTRQGATVLLALHDIGLIELFDRVLLMRDGGIVGDGTPGDLMNQIGGLFGLSPVPGTAWRMA